MSADMAHRGAKPSTCAAMQADPSDPRHGTENGYHNLHCRCQRCRAAHVTDRRRLQLLRCDQMEPDDPRHGTENGYGNWVCRCRACTDAWSAAAYKRKQRARERAET